MLFSVRASTVACLALLASAAAPLVACGGSDEETGLDAALPVDGGPDAALAEDASRADGSSPDAPGDAPRDATTPDADDDASEGGLDGGTDGADAADAATQSCGSTGGTVVSTFADLLALEGCRVVTGDLTITIATATDLAPLHALEEVTGTFRIGSGNWVLAGLHGLERLTTVGGGLSFDYAASLQSTDALGALRTVTGTVSVSGLVKLERLRLPALVRSGNFDVRSSDLLGEVDLPVLASAGDVTAWSLPALTRFSVPSLVTLGSLSLSNATRLESFSAPALVRVERELYLTDSALTTVREFGALTQVGAALMIGGDHQLARIDGFGALTQVGESLVVSDCNSLASLEGFHALTSTAGLKIDALPALNSLEGLRGLVSIRKNPLPEHDFAGLSTLPLVKDLRGLRNLQIAEGDFYVSAVGAPDLRGLESLTRVGQELLVASNPVMTRLTGLEGLRSVGYQTRIRGNPALVSISSLDALTDAGTDGIRITENDALQRIDGVRALVSMQPRASIYITDDRALTQVDGFDRVEVTSTLEVYGAKVATIHGFGALTLATGSVRLIVPTLRTLDALGSLARVDGDVLLQAKALASMRELSALTSVGGELFIGQCGITSAGDLRSLRTVGGRLTFAGDPALLHVNVLPSLTGVGELVVIDNATLPACDAQGLLDALVAKGFVGTATLDKNDGTGACN